MSKFANLGMKRAVAKAPVAVPVTPTATTAVAEKKKPGRPAKATSAAPAPVETAKKKFAPRVGTAKNAEKPTLRKVEPATVAHDKNEKIVYLSFQQISFHDQIVNERSKAEVDKNAEELRKDILNRGLLQPLVVAHVDGSYCLCDGFSRYQAIASFDERQFKKLFPNGIPCSVAGTTLDEGILASFASNLQRETVSTASTFNGIVRIKDKFQPAEIAKAVRKNISTVRQYIQISEDCHPDVIAAFLEGSLTIQDALRYSKLDPEKQLEALRGVEEAVEEEGEESVVQSSSSQKAAKEKALAPEQTGPRPYTKAQTEAFSTEFAKKAVALANSDSAGKNVYALEDLYSVIHLTASLIAGHITPETFSAKVKKTKTFTKELVKSVTVS